MIPSTYPDEFAEALPRLLFAPGEQLVNLCSTYAATFNRTVSNGRVHETYAGSTSLDVALTNINVRWFTWRTVKVKTGFLQYRWQTLPELASEGSIALSKITTVKSKQAQLIRAAEKDFERRLGGKIGACTFLTINWQGGSLEQFSPFDCYPTLIKNLELALSGSALSNASHSVAEAVAELAALRSDGVLTDEEFERSKAGFLGSTVEVVESSASLLRQLHSLKQSGVLTESEFNLKKWDVLSHPR